jgi:hypothetical protein
MKLLCECKSTWKSQQLPRKSFNKGDNPDEMWIVGKVAKNVTNNQAIK